MAQSNRARAETFGLFPLYLTLSSVNTLGLRSSCLEGVLLADARLGHGLYRRWGIKTAREYARIKINGLRLVGGNPDFTPTRPGTATTTHASTTGSKLTYTLKGCRRRNPRAQEARGSIASDYSASGLRH